MTKPPPPSGEFTNRFYGPAGTDQPPSGSPPLTSPPQQDEDGATWITPQAALVREDGVSTIHLLGDFWEKLVRAGCPAHLLTAWLAPCIFVCEERLLVVPSPFYREQVPERAGFWLKMLFGGYLPAIIVIAPAHAPPSPLPQAGRPDRITHRIALLINGLRYSDIAGRARRNDRRQDGRTASLSSPTRPTGETA